MEISIKIPREPIDKMRDLPGQARRYFSNLVSFWQGVRPLCIRAYREIFEKKGIPKWKPATTRYARWKEGARRRRISVPVGMIKLPVRYGPGQIGKRTGAMSEALVTKTRYGHYDKIWPMSMEWGTDAGKIPYTEHFHKHRKLDLAPYQEDRFQRALEDYVKEKLMEISRRQPALTYRR